MSKIETTDVLREHPICPTCGSETTITIFSTRSATYIWRSFGCLSCMEVFHGVETIPNDPPQPGQSSGNNSS